MSHIRSMDIEENWKDSNPVKDFSEMQNIGKWSVWIMEFPVQ